jgi:hypothetical protein
MIKLSETGNFKSAPTQKVSSSKIKSPTQTKTEKVFNENSPKTQSRTSKSKFSTSSPDLNTSRKKQKPDDSPVLDFDTFVQLVQSKDSSTSESVAANQNLSSLSPSLRNLIPTPIPFESSPPQESFATLSEIPDSIITQMNLFKDFI